MSFTGRALGRLSTLASRRTFIWLGIIGVASIALGFVPLFDLLGYDYAFVVGLLVTPAAIDVGHGYGATARQTNPAASLPSVAVTATWRALALLVIPLASALLRAFWVRNCNLAAGFAFFLLLPIGSVVFAAPLGATVGLTVIRRGRLWALGIPIVSLLWTVMRLYRDPPAYALDPFGGFFPGPIYDEALEPPLRLLVYRVVNLVWLGTAVAIVHAIRARRTADRRPLLVVIAVIFGVAGAAIFVERARLGFSRGKNDLIAILKRETRSAHFIVHSDPTGDGTPDDRALVIRDLEFRYDELTSTLGVTPAGQVTVYLFASGAQKKDLVGAGGTLYAKPWKREIFVQSDRFPARHLRHELAHVFAGAFGDPLFGISLAWRLPPRVSTGLVEGIAEAADYGDPDGRATVHQEARAMIAAGLAPPLAKVVGAGFTTVAGARAYTMAGSFTHFLLATYGRDKLREAYRSGGDFAGVYGMTLARLEPEWRKFLEAQPVDPQENARAREVFRRPAIFQKVCARDIAARIETARNELYSQPEEALALFESVCADDPAEPSYRLHLADAKAASGDPEGALAIAQPIASDESMTLPLRARAANIMAMVHYHAGRFDEARAAVAQSGRFATDEGEERTAFARTRALADETTRATLGRMLFGDSLTRGVDPALVVLLADRFARRFPNEALGPYMLGRQLVGRDPKLALAPLTEACPLDDATAATDRIPLLPVFVTECRRLIGEAGFRAKDFATSERAWRLLQAGAPTLAERLRAGDFLARLAWEERPQGH